MARAEKYPNGGTGGWNLPKKGGLRIKQPKIVSQSDMIEKNKKWLVLGVVAVAGFIAYKKFKK
jgi:hypothetical protein